MNKPDRALASDYAENFKASAIRGLGEETLRGYLRQLRWLARVERMSPGLGPRFMLEERLLQIAKQEQAESTIKAVLSAARLAEKSDWIDRKMHPRDWYLVVAAELRRSKEERGAAKEWAQVGELTSIARKVETPAELEVVAAACLSADCLRRTGVVGVTSMGEGNDKAQLRGTKSQRGEQEQERGRGRRAWLKFLCRLRALGGHHPNRGAWIHSGTAPGDAMVRLLDKPGQGRKTVRWRGLCWFEGAQLYRLGLPLSLVMLWGGWNSKKVACMYVQAPPRWKFERCAELPWPAGEGGGEGRAVHGSATWLHARHVASPACGRWLSPAPTVFSGCLPHVSLGVSRGGNVLQALFRPPPLLPGAHVPAGPAAWSLFASCTG